MTKAQQEAITGEDVLTIVRSDILSLALRPGQKLSTVFLTERYPYGASPLREALSCLVGEGLAVRESGRGFRVSPMSRCDLDDLIATRLLIEPMLMERAMRDGDRDWESEIERSVKELRINLHKVGDCRPLDRDWEDSHKRFHFALLGLMTPSVFAEFCQLLYQRYDRYRVLAVPRRAYLAGVASDHHDMAEAAIARNMELAVEILTRHISDTSDVLISNIESAGLVKSDGSIEVPPTGTNIA
jgi:GntR family carbon starvation induced transcriptional regulator